MSEWRMCLVVSNTFTRLIEIRFACSRYFTSISTRNVCSSYSFLTTATWEVVYSRGKQSGLQWNYVRKERNFFFHFSVARIRHLLGSRKFTCYFSRKKTFIQNSQFLGQFGGQMPEKKSRKWLVIVQFWCTRMQNLCTWIVVLTVHFNLPGRQ